MNQIYYYCYSLLLEPGSVILPGNWWRILRTYKVGAQTNTWLLVRELIFEQVRNKYYPEKPSRLESIFLCPNEEKIKEFRVSTNRNLDIIYKVELLDSDKPTHISDWTLANFQNEDDYQSFEDKAKKYWEAKEINNTEVITLSKIKIIERIAL